MDYATQERDAAEAAGEGLTPVKTRPSRRNSDSDTDFLAEYSADDDTEEDGPVTAEGPVAAGDLEERPDGRSRGLAAAEMKDKASKNHPAGELLRSIHMCNHVTKGLIKIAKEFKRANAVIHAEGSYEVPFAVDGAGDVPPFPRPVIRQWYVPIFHVSVTIFKPGTSAAFGMPFSFAGPLQILVALIHLTVIRTTTRFAAYSVTVSRATVGIRSEAAR